MKGWVFAVVVAGLLGVGAVAALPAASSSKADPLIARGRYLVGFGTCNDCHTPGWRESDGTAPIARWMVGTNVGYRGPWGTSYPANVRLEFARISESDWLFMVRTRAGHWPMVWHDLRFLSLTDQRAVYRFIKSLGPAGTPAPADLAPDVVPKTPYVWVLPQ